MNLLDYIKANFDVDEPIFLYELPGKSENAKRQEMKKLVDQGKLSRLYNGVYFQNYKTILGTEGKASIRKFVDKKFLNPKGKVSGYKTGIGLLNEYGFTSQVPAVIEVASNEATTKQRKLKVGGRRIIVYKPRRELTEENLSSLRFLDLLLMIDRYAEFDEETIKKKIASFIEETKVDFGNVKECLPFYPDRIYRVLYEWGIMKELIHFI